MIIGTITIVFLIADSVMVFFRCFECFYNTLMGKKQSIFRLRIEPQIPLEILRGLEVSEFSKHSNSTMLN